MPIPENELIAIEQAVRRHPAGASAELIAGGLTKPLPKRTLQYRLRHLVDQGRLIQDGGRRWAKYRLPPVPNGKPVSAASEPSQEALIVPLSPASVRIREQVRRPLPSRKPVGYVRRFLDSYRPNVSSYLSEEERTHLAKVGRPTSTELPAGTYAKKILNRLLIDLAWNSSRLEGNTYSLLDTKKLIELGQAARGRAPLETQMILNHKDAIEFLVNSADDIGFNRYTVLNLHGLLANNLLADPMAVGRLRYIAVGIEQSVFHPLEVPQLIEECFDQILTTAAAIADPFEQAFFVMVQLPYLQPFDDVNKRVSRLAANIPLIKGNLSPLSFEGVPRQTYTEAVLGVYELNKIDLLKDVFLWAYDRSIARYAAVRQSLGEPDPFRLRLRVQLRQVVAEVIRARLDRKHAVTRVKAWARETIEPADRKRFVAVVETELASLHEGNFARYQVRPSEFEAWWATWKET